MRILSHRIVTLTPQRMEQRVYRERPDWPRTKGVVHVQSVNGYLAIAAGQMKPESDAFPAFSPALYPLLPAMGVAWEDMWASLHTEDQLLWQPGEWSRDGIYGTPDGLMMDRASPVIAECKLTYKKHKSVTEDWKYMRQGMAYCALSNGMTQVEYHVCWALSDYMKPYQPVYDVTLVEFEEREIETWFGRMMAVKGKVKAE